jgi:hypothetical protein
MAYNHDFGFFAVEGHIPLVLSRRKHAFSTSFRQAENKLYALTCFRQVFDTHFNLDMSRYMYYEGIDFNTIVQITGCPK